MKKFMTLAVIALGLSFSASAQRKCDIQTLVNAPTIDPVVTLNCGNNDSLSLDFYFINLGPDSLIQFDTLWFANPGADVGYVNGAILNSTVRAMDTISVVFKLGYPEIKKFNDPNDLQSEIAKADFASGTTYACLIGIDRVGSFNGEIEDTNDTNNYDAGLVKVDCTTGIKGLAKNNSTLKVFPNPANNQVSFTNDFAITTIANVRITDIAGRVVKTMDLGKQNAGAKTFNIDIADLNNGMYYLEVITENKRSINKFIKN